MTLLSSCSHRIRGKDGSPNFYVDAEKIPDAEPKKEPLSKYGNMPSYRVFGKRYYTLKSSKNYDAQGIASWYGKKFHAKRTSSGEPYNMLSMTAAHKTLPLPSYVEVTNLKNNRKVIVKVNDRGPFSGSRLIDLSYVAAKKLDMIGRGTAYVRVKSVDINPFRFREEKSFYFSQAPSKPEVKGPLITANTMATSHNQAGGQPLYLQVGAFRHKFNALKLKKRLADLIKAPVEISQSARNTLFRVKIGPIKDNQALDKMKDRLQTLGISPYKV
jgi:rare lipoprotein A